ncbi:hypothetical protein METBIDRAFT_68849 [Metschnikowia bicuspidata var. bicuspidata NRRL YB-4993]|uniref:ferric-chelate reductase (NADPH) n=1 Tax=Metschnikowia bicuspidata var. bicuspidata NRRL YB-4993 TaxID=869754 RepID=A0A1A0HA86_9ASCO|nr:hypothetical protein METBIDRAFT_68849 [Metschnikowia bicuspidata var. bicuspidata NRRL YB-4993]OBA20915.1 hypothetical protein METBIDRAFT_68849 [Metschnikowia bicuspidata var. bicuspidata NRRL YB-4993]
MQNFQRLLGFLCLVVNVLAYQYKSFSLYGEGLAEVRSCHSVLYSSVTFCEGQKRRGYSCYCSNENAMASMAGCVQLIQQDPGNVFEWFVSYCNSRNQSITQKQLYASLQYFKQSAKPFTALAAKSKRLTRIDYPVYANHTALSLYYQAYRERYDTFNWAYWLANALYAYWAFVFLIAAACNWSVVIFPGLRKMFNGRLSKTWRRYVTLPALVKKKKTTHQQFLGILNLLIPTRLETIILSGFLLLTVLFNALYMPYTEGNPLFSTRSMFILRVVADRTGIIGTLLLPILILIGGRNNFLQWLTKWRFSTFVMYHRWIGRAIVAMVFIHSVAYTAYVVKKGGYASFMSQEYIIYGTVATTAGCIICFQGLLYLRRNWYEVFLVIHILMAVAFMLGTWMHIRMRMYMEWLFASVAVWSFDRLVRILRMIWFGFPQATVTLLADDCLRVVVPKPNHWPSVPGGHAWVYFCHSWYFWQSHPFTFLDSTVEENKIVFVLKTKKGATNYLTKLLATRPGKTGTIRVCVEGPYGEACSVKHQDNVVFVAGGNGIPGIFSECYDLAQKSANNAKQWIKLIWVLREILTIEWVWEELSSLKNTKVEATVYITRPEGGNDDVLLQRMTCRSESSSTDEKESLSKEGMDIFDRLRQHFPHVTFKSGRPLMDAIVDKETEEAAGSAAFITCGHPIMVDDLRYAVVQKIDKTEKRVDFFEQLQVWA